MAYTNKTLKDGAGADFTAAVWTPGRDAAANGQPVALSTEDLAALTVTRGAGNVDSGTQRVTLAADGPGVTRLGDVAETAPASDTASSGLNGRLQRVAQRLTSLIAQLPLLGLSRTAMLAAVTATGAGSATADGGRAPSFSANVAGTGAVTATVVVEARNTASGVWFTLATITLSGTTSAADGFATLARYMEYRGNLTAISGTGAAVTLTMGS